MDLNKKPIKNNKLGLIGRKRYINTKSEEENIEKEEKKSNSNDQIILCEICKINPYKYNCPRCLMKTCSIECSKKHKKKYNCNGIKDKFTLTNKQEDYTEKTFHRDIQYLNNTIKDINISNRKVFNLTEDVNLSKNKMFKTFKRILKKFHGINYFKSPFIMSCNEINKSYSDSANKKIFWTIKFNFLDEKLSYVFNKEFDGDATNINFLIKYLNDNKQSVNEKNVDILKILSLKDWDKEYNFYLKMDIFKLSLEEKKNLFYYKKYYFYLCDLDTGINELLKGKDVYEFPEFYLIKKTKKD